MGKVIEMAGKTFGRLTVVRQADGKAGTNTLWECRCECGTVKAVSGFNLRAGKSRSCGCLQREAVAKAARALMTTHGMSRSRVYRSWCAMWTRCTNPAQKDWNSYGGRGIKVCDRWKSFENFRADMGEPPAGMSLDRINTDGDYSPENCRWATPKQQTRNKRTNVWYEVNGVRMIEQDAAAALGVDHSMLHSRRWRGAPLPEGVRVL